MIKEYILEKLSGERYIVDVINLVSDCINSKFCLTYNEVSSSKVYKIAKRGALTELAVEINTDINRFCKYRLINNNSNQDVFSIKEDSICDIGQSLYLTFYTDADYIYVKPKTSSVNGNFIKVTCVKNLYNISVLEDGIFNTDILPTLSEVFCYKREGDINYRTKLETRLKQQIHSVNFSTYYDTTLNKQIWWNGSNWIDSTGATV